MTLAKMKQWMLSGKMYNDLDPLLVQARADAVLLCKEYQQSLSRPPQQRLNILKRLLHQVEDDAYFEPGFRCEFGFHITIGKNFYANFDCVMLDGGGITIGNHVLLGPRVGLYTSNHAIDIQERIQGGCYAAPITIEDNVWVGGGVHIMQGVTIHEGSVIGAGSVVTKDVPANVIAAGNPCRVIRSINERDKTGFNGVKTM